MAPPAAYTRILFIKAQYSLLEPSGAEAT